MFSALAPAVLFKVYQAKPVIDQDQLCRHARQCRVDKCIVLGLQAPEGGRRLRAPAPSRCSKRVPCLTSCSQNIGNIGNSGDERNTGREPA